MARGNKNELVKCEYCGEMYSVTYKHCPFCNEDGTGAWDDPNTAPDEIEYTSHQGGRRVMGGKGPSVKSIIWGVLSLALIIAAVGIVASILRSTLGKKTPTAETSKPPVTSAAPSKVPTETLPAVSASALPVESHPVASQPAVSAAPVETKTPSAVTSQAPANLPASFVLNREDFTFYKAGEQFQMVAKFTPADSKAEVTWTSSDPNIAAISWNGLVTGIRRGTVTLTAKVEGVGEKTCICRCDFDGTGTAPATTPAPGGTTTTTPGAPGLYLNREDFTLFKAGETFQMKVTGTTSAVVWNSTNPAVATISTDGLVKGVAKGTCKVTATVDGKTLECIVRCSF